ncbi:MAG: cytochrome P450 [Anaerolineae bacterium]|nr:cytochrome P450 [Anaerolineae bacterium]
MASVMATATPIPTPADATFESTVDGLRNQPVPFAARLAHTYGDIVRLPFGGRDLYLVNQPDYIREIFLGDAEVYKKRKDADTEKAYLESIGGFLPLFQDSLIPQYAPSMVEAAQRANERWQRLAQGDATPSVDIYREMMRITLDIVVRTLFRADVGDEAAALVDDILTMDVGYGFDPVAATLGEFMPPDGIALTPEGEAARGRILAFVQRVAATKGGDPDPGESFLSMLLRYLGADMGANVAMTVMFAMHEVSATTLTWAWYLLSQSPDVEAQLHEELNRVLGGRPPTYDDVAHLPYTMMTLAETRRLYPSVWLIGRFLRADVAFDGYHVPADSVVLASQDVTHRDPRYFPEPDRFDPLRWTSEAQAARPEFSYFPFSAGPRACAGEKFAEIMDPLVLATLAQHWQARLTPGQTFEPRPAKSNAPRPGIQMTLHHR